MNNLHVYVPVDCSQMVYPVAGREEADLQDLSQMTSGKYEPLVHMNALLSEEIRKTMAEVNVASECIMKALKCKPSACF